MVFKKVDTLFLEVTNRCYNNCIMCSHHLMKREHEDMPIDLICHLIQSVRPRRVIFHFFGEPLLYKKLEMAIAYGKKYGAYCELDTVGELLTVNKFIALSKCGLDKVIVSFCGSNKEIHNSVWRNVNYDRVKINLSQIMYAKNRLGLRTKLNIRAIVTKENEHDIDKSRRLFDTRFYCDRWSEVKEFHLYGYDRTPWIRRNRPTCKRQRKLYKEMIIKSNGDMVLCCNDLDGDFVIGNVYQYDVMDLWRGNMFRSYRKEIETNTIQLSICKECGIRNW